LFETYVNKKVIINLCQFVSSFACLIGEQPHARRGSFIASENDCESSIDFQVHVQI